MEHTCCKSSDLESKQKTKHHESSISYLLSCNFNLKNVLFHKRLISQIAIKRRRMKLKKKTLDFTNYFKF
jgi:hypothetical protein